MMVLAIRNYFSRAKCWVTGHTRGRRISETPERATFECRRCGATWSRAERKKAAA